MFVIEVPVGVSFSVTAALGEAKLHSLSQPAAWGHTAARRSSRVILPAEAVAGAPTDVVALTFSRCLSGVFRSPRQ